jgi:hypothetical protein
VIEYLLSKAIVGWGSQCIGTDAGQAGGMTPPFPAHNLLHKAGRYGLASLANLDQLPPKGAILIAAPLKIKSGTARPSGRWPSCRGAERWRAPMSSSARASTRWSRRRCLRLKGDKVTVLEREAVLGGLHPDGRDHPAGLPARRDGGDLGAVRHGARPMGAGARSWSGMGSSSATRRIRRRWCGRTGRRWC